MYSDPNGWKTAPGKLYKKRRYKSAIFTSIIIKLPNLKMWVGQMSK